MPRNLIWIHFLYNYNISEGFKIWYSTPFFLFENPLYFWSGIILKLILSYLFKEILCKIFPLQFQKEFLYKLIGDLNRKFYKFPLILICVRFTRNLHWIFFQEILYKIFPTLNFKLNFIRIKKLFHKNSKIPHLYLSCMSYKFVNFQKN